MAVQPKQTLKEKRILDFIYHNHLENNIYLFLRTNKKWDYTYMGKLEYLDDDKLKEKPVHFKWRIINWDPSEQLLKEIGLTLIDDADLPTYSPTNSSLLLKDPPYTSTSLNSNRKFHGKTINFNEKEEQNKSIGLKGEKLVLEYERKRLKLYNRKDLAEQIVHVSEIEGDGKGMTFFHLTWMGQKDSLKLKPLKEMDKHLFIYLQMNLPSFKKIKTNT